MKKTTSFKLPKCLLLLLFFSQFSFGQLSNFTLNVTFANETCTENGSLSFTTANTLAGATMLYSIYLLPNTTTPIATLSGNTYGGLAAGTYMVVATQSLGGQSASKQQTVTILNQITLLTYQLTGINSVGCVNNGQIIVNVTTGTAVWYEIFAGPIIKPLQSSNIFTGLSAGVYQIRVFDNCGEGVVQTFTLLSSPAGLNISGPGATPPNTCGTTAASHTFSAPSGTVLAYPLTVVLTLFPPTGAPIVYTQTIASGPPTGYNFSEQIALYANQGYNYNLQVTDACGNGYSANSVPAASSTTPTAIPSTSIVNCQIVTSILISFVQTVILVSAPPAYPNALPHNYTPGISNAMITIGNLPYGTYTFNVTDVCGNPHVLTATLNPPSIPNPNFSIREGCDSGNGSVSISNASGPMVSIIITQAPATYTLAPLPHNVSFNINSANAQNFQMNMLPAGNYRFRIVDNCGNQFDVNVTIQGHQITTNTYAVTENCGSFNLLFDYASNNSFNNTFWLQKLNPITNQWGHPGTGTVYNPGDILGPLNSRAITNHVNNLNLAYLGTFRIIMSFQIFGLGGFSSTYCTRVLNQFEFDNIPEIEDVYSFSCSPTSSDVIVVATGLAPLIYRITEKNGLPFSVLNGNSNTFLGLEPAIYNFQVEDACGNILNAVHDITTPYSFQVIPANLCDGQNGSLSVASFPFLNYQWWKDGTPLPLLSTTSQLTFPNFNSVTNQGTYFVQITNPAATSCINQTLSFTITPNPAAPNAGSNGAISYCGNPTTTVDLFSLLTGPYDTTGVWSALSAGGVLTNNIWNATGVAPGVYVFRYTVTGFCSNDQADVIITIRAIPQTPVASSTPVICESQSLQLFATSVANATYQWSGPNNFTSTLQNPTINAALAVNGGTYTVQTLQNGCASPPTSVTVQVVAAPLAGVNSTMDYCGSQGTIDLFSLLNGTYNVGGVWSAVGTGGTLTNNIWNATGVAPGVYQFMYTVTSASCSGIANSIVSITLRPTPQVPVATATPFICDRQPLQLFATTIPNATYQWSGPNNFTSTLQNPIINSISAVNNGIYTVQSIQNGCPSGSSSITVQVAPLPEFAIRFDCIDNVAVLSAAPISNSFDAASATYEWTNEDGFSSSDNPVVITGQTPGIYTLTVTSGGCPNTNSIDVEATLCSIPQGVSPNSDGLNDAFDLSGYTNITKVKIYNRYGMVVFEQDNYVNQWMGQDKRGNLLPSATYYYLVNFENREPRTGWVYLLREN